MKLTILAICFFILFSIPCFGQEEFKTRFQNAQTIENCSANSDSLYNRQRVLEQLAGILNASIPEFEKQSGFKFYVENEKAGAFVIYDLTNTANNNVANTKSCIEFIDNHIYHIVPRTHSFSFFSHIIILESGSLRVFKSINCKDRGETLETVVIYLNQKLTNNKNKNEILERVKNYRRYGRYSRMDNFSTIQCQQF